MSGQMWMLIAILAIIFLFLCYRGVKPMSGGA
jgi:hypothetical protein